MPKNKKPKREPVNWTPAEIEAWRPPPREPKPETEAPPEDTTDAEQT